MEDVPIALRSPVKSAKRRHLRGRNQVAESRHLEPQVARQSPVEQSGSGGGRIKGGAEAPRPPENGVTFRVRG